MTIMETTDPIIIQTNHVVRRAIIRVRLLGRSIETMNELYSEYNNIEKLPVRVNYFG